MTSLRRIQYCPTREEKTAPRPNPSLRQPIANRKLPQLTGKNYGGSASHKPQDRRPWCANVREVGFVVVSHGCSSIFPWWVGGSFGEVAMALTQTSTHVWTESKPDFFILNSRTRIRVYNDVEKARPQILGSVMVRFIRFILHSFG